MKTIHLSQIADLAGGRVVGNPQGDPSCSALYGVSSEVTPGGVFVAIRGASRDGHEFIQEARNRGAVAAVVEDPGALQGIPGVVVGSTRRALSRLAAAFNDYPSRDISCVGITGTNGKTTTNWILYHVLNLIGGGCQRIGTLGSECMGQATRVGELTSPDPFSIQKLLSEARCQGAKFSVLEASSHALDQARVEDVEFDVAVFTNLTRDHLDYHQTLDKYFEAKCHLFELVSRSSKRTKGAVINGDDEYGRRLIAKLPEWGLKDWSFGASTGVALRLSAIEELAETMVITLDDAPLGRAVSVRVPLIGRHNAENCVSAYGACRALGYQPEVILSAMERVPQVPGRLERIGRGAPRVFVDYAHTPDALLRVLQAVRPTTLGELWVVFGCGGDRDKGKRPMMAAVASEYADQVVITSDNPRTESPQAIINDIMVGAVSPRIVEVDRKRAIIEALTQASARDTVVIAGKGHEDYQIIGREKIYFSDQAVAREVLGA